MAQNLSIEAKRSLYDNGRYNVGAPPVCTARWTRDDWIAFIDASGHFVTSTAHAITTDNPADIPLRLTGYYRWLKDGNYNGHRVEDLRHYLDHMAFERGTDVLSAGTINVLRFAHDMYFEWEIKPNL